MCYAGLYTILLVDKRTCSIAVYIDQLRCTCTLFMVKYGSMISYNDVEGFHFFICNFVVFIFIFLINSSINFDRLICLF